MLRTGKPGSNTAADHIAVLTDAISRVPAATTRSCWSAATVLARPTTRWTGSPNRARSAEQQAVGTPWGLFRHYWVLISLVITAFATTILVLHLPAVGDMAILDGDPTASVTGLNGDLFHSVGGLLVLLIPLVLNSYKPRGLTLRVACPATRASDTGLNTPPQVSASPPQKRALRHGA